MRRVMVATIALALVVLISVWATAFVISIVQPGGHNCFVIGYAQKEGSSSNVVCHADGWVLAQHFPVNFSPQEGFYAKLSRMGMRNRLSWRVFVPHWWSKSTATAAMFHLLLALVPFSLLETCLLTAPPLKHRWRRRRGLCIRCGYDLRGATSPLCSECGWRNDWAIASSAASTEAVAKDAVDADSAGT